VEVTVSYRGGTAKGPEAVLRLQRVDLYDEDIKDAWKVGISMEPIPLSIEKKNTILRKGRVLHHSFGRRGSADDAKLKKNYQDINKGCEELHEYVEKECARLLKMGKAVGLVEIIVRRLGI
jgi:agmatinase